MFLRTTFFNLCWINSMGLCTQRSSNYPLGLCFLKGNELGMAFLLEKRTSPIASRFLPVPRESSRAALREGGEGCCTHAAFRGSRGPSCLTEHPQNAVLGPAGYKEEEQPSRMRIPQGFLCFQHRGDTERSDPSTTSAVSQSPVHSPGWEVL